MVLQRGLPVRVWGWAAPGEHITVQLAGHEASVTADAGGDWSAVLPEMSAGGPFEMVVTGSNVVRFSDVLVGEVWLCSGQSNMELGIGKTDNAQAEIAAADHPQIRLFPAPNRWSPTPQTNVVGTWKICSPKTVAEGGWQGFSACAYYFGRKLNAELNVPVGLIQATWGGTCIQSWTPPEGYASVPALDSEYRQVLLSDPQSPQHEQRLAAFLRDLDDWRASAGLALTNRSLVPPMPAYPSELLPPHDLQNATALYNGMIHPFQQYGIAGAIWYQGEANLGDGGFYFQRMQALIHGWRTLWQEGDFPFYYVQIAPFNYGGHPESEAALWEGQARALSVTNTGMAVINDIGNLRDIHPTDKKDVGERLALIALAKTYGRTNLEYSGPVFQSLRVEGGKLRVQFDHAEGLKTRDGQPPSWFEIIDATRGGFVSANAQIDGDSVLLSSPDAPNPVAMRFAWSMLAVPNLVNAAGLPASAFRAGDMPNRDMLEMAVPEARDYQLVYDLDLSKAGRQIHYDRDLSAGITKPFDRVAWFLELQPATGPSQYVFVSVQAFTDNVHKLGVPTLDSGAHFQQNVAHMNVFSDVPGVVTGTNLSGGNLEFWPGNYGPENSANVPGASSQVFDFGDAPAPDADGYGSMQVHNHDARQTIFAYNHWSEGEHADVGIGNNPSGNPDWTFAGNANQFVMKRLRVLVRCP